MYSNTTELSFVAIDFETANHDPTSACALGLCFVEAGKLVEVRKYLIKPRHGYFYFTFLHGIGPHEVEDAPSFPEVWSAIQPQLDMYPFLAAHNAPFDRKVMRESCRAYRVDEVTVPFVCTVRLAKSVLGISPANLPSVAAALGIYLDHHDPGSDAEACARIVLEAAARGWRFPGRDLDRGSLRTRVGTE